MAKLDFSHHPRNLLCKGAERKALQESPTSSPNWSKDHINLFHHSGKSGRSSLHTGEYDAVSGDEEIDMHEGADSVWGCWL